LNHPQWACGCRIESQGAVIVYATDLEPGHSKLDKVLRDHAQGADILIFNAHCTTEEYVRNRGWGHSPWREAVRVTRDGNVERLVLFHHAPAHDDQFLSDLMGKVTSSFENTLVAREGWVAAI
jgi:ribonuclease BN (tRNA processing enzyme)